MRPRSYGDVINGSGEISPPNCWLPRGVRNHHIVEAPAWYVLGGTQSGKRVHVALDTSNGVLFDSNKDAIEARGKLPNNLTKSQITYLQEGDYYEVFLGPGLRNTMTHNH